MATKVSGGPTYIAAKATVDLVYQYGGWNPQRPGGANMGGRYAYALPVSSVGSAHHSTGAYIITESQGVYLYNRGPREPNGWEYNVTVRNLGPSGAWVEVFVVGLDALQ
jgi:hypothetical protein